MSVVCASVDTRAQIAAVVGVVMPLVAMNWTLLQFRAGSELDA